MFAANARALRCPVILFEAEVLAEVHSWLVSPMLSIMAGLGTRGATSQLGLIPICRDLLEGFPFSEDQVLDMLQGKLALIEGVSLRARGESIMAVLMLPLVADYLGECVSVIQPAVDAGEVDEDAMEIDEGAVEVGRGLNGGRGGSGGCWQAHTQEPDPPTPSGCS
jgi:hypothetical protein